MSRSSLSRLFLAVAVLASSMPASAGMFDNVSKPEMKYGPVELHPYLKLSEVYDSNIFLAPRSKVAGNNANNNNASPVIGSWIHNVNLGAKAAVNVSEQHKLNLAYDLLYKAYKHEPRDNNTVNQTVDAMYSYKGPGGINANLKNTYLNTVDPATSELVERKRRWQNTAGLDVEYAPEGGALYASVDGAQTTHKYVAKDNNLRALNRYEQLMGFKVGYMVMPKTRAYVAYHRQIVHYSNHPASPTKNSKSHLVEVGVEGDLAPKLTGQIQTGLQNRKYDDAPAAGQNRSSNAWIVSTKLGYKPLERTKVDLSLSRSLQESTAGGNQYYTASAAGLNVSHQLPWKLTAGLMGGVEIDQYPENSVIAVMNAGAFVNNINVNRRDDIYQVGGTLDYDVQEWMKVGVSHMYRTRYSKNLSEQFNYKDHQTGLSVGVMF